MDEPATSQFPLNCTNLTQQQLEYISLARGTTGMISCVMVTTIFLLLLSKRAYKTLLQRLFLYHVITTMLFEGLYASTFSHYFQYRGQEQVCKVLGFLTQYISSAALTFIIEIILYLISVVYYSMKGSNHPIEKSVCLKRSLEGVILIIAIAFPMTYVWFPFIKDNYGTSTDDYSTCWIAPYGEGCDKGDQDIMLVFVYFKIGFIIVLLIMLAIMYCTMAKRYHNLRLRSLFQQTILYIVVLAIFALVALVSSITGFPGYSFRLISAVVLPLSISFLPVLFLAHVYSNNLKCGCHVSCLKRERATERENLLITEHYSTRPSSNPQQVPSYTHFNNEYTGQFTDITD